MEIQREITDKRRKFKGPVCETIVPKFIIVKAIMKLKIPPPVDVNLEDKQNMIKKLMKEQKGIKDELIKYTKEELENMSDAEFANVFFWYYKASKPLMCSTLKKWFEEKDLLKTT